MMLLCGEIDNKMRKGGSMRLKKVHSTFLTAALACSLAVTPVFANPAEDAENLKNQKTEAESELSNLQTQFDTLIQKANELELKLIKTGEAIIQAQADLEAAEEKKEEQYEAMKKRIKFMYESGTGSATVEKVMTSGDMSSMLSQAEYSQKMHEYDREQLKEYTNTVTEIENLQKTLEEEQKNLEATEKEYEAEQATLTETINSKKDEITNLDGMIQEAARKAEEERTARIEAAMTDVGVSYNPTMEASAEEVWLLACVIDWESGWEPYEGKLAVANVVLNRVRNSRYDNTITGVIYARSQFSGVSDGYGNASSTFQARLDAGPRTQECLEAAMEALSGVNNIGSYTSFRSVSIANYDAYSSFTIIGGHVFY